MRFGFNPRFMPTSRAGMVHQLREALLAAERLEFDVIELSVSRMIFDYTLDTVFGGEFLDLLQRAKPRFHVNIFPFDPREGELGMSDPSPYPRSLALRRLIHVIEFFEAQHPMGLYIIHAGATRYAGETHLASLRQALAALDVLYPGLPLAIINDGPGSVLGRPRVFLELLDATPNLRFVLNTGLAWRAVDYDHDGYAWLLRSLKRFDDRLAEIHWSSGAPGAGPNRPLHIISDDGLDIVRTLGMVGRNPALVHLFETVGSHQHALARERRCLYNARMVY
ncbi:MAG: hypothetical protein OXU67_05195 [Chloroflexota bacterium]|nr:hypothetical protein [Chloroflexota bacterium]